MSIKALLRRVAKLEPKPSRILRCIGGSVEKFEAEMQAGLDAGRYCERDVPTVVSAIRKWVST